MAPEKIGLGEAIDTLVNPCPEMTERELYIECELVPPANAEKRQAFAIEHRHSTGLEEEFLTMQPGESRQIPTSIAKSIYREHVEQGMALIPAGTEDVRPLILRALDAAINFFRENGVMRLEKHTLRKGWGDQTLKRMRQQHAGYYLNEKKADILQTLRDRLYDELHGLEASGEEEAELTKEERLVRAIGLLDPDSADHWVAGDKEGERKPKVEHLQRAIGEAVSADERDFAWELFREQEEQRRAASG